MLATFVLAAALAQDPIAVLKSIRDAYQKLDSYSATLEHHDSSGLFPGEYTQTLKWRKGNQFELVVTKPNPAEVKSPGRNAPNYYSNGQTVVRIRETDRREESIVPGPNTMPGWEVSGGLALSFLVNSKSMDILFEPQPNFPIEWKSVVESKWQGERGKRIDATFNKQLGVRIFYAENPLRLVGVEYEEGGKKHWMRYVSQDFAPKLPEKLGDPPPR